MAKTGTLRKLTLTFLVLGFVIPYSAFAGGGGSCPAYVDSYVYYSGCGTKTYAGDVWEDCNGYSGTAGTGGTVGNWRVRLRQTCGGPYGPANLCYEDVSTYTYWEYCNGTWVERTATQFNNADCQC
jgi:hypothetical protein